MKKVSAREKFFAKSEEEQLLAFAQELKDNITAFIFSCYEFDAVPTEKGKLFRHRRLADCHLNGLVMLDIDHVDNPLEVFEAWKKNDELVKRTALVHITSSKKGIRFVFTANIKDGNLADNQIVFAQALGYSSDTSCIDATRNSFAPKEEDILYMNENLLFDYYDEKYDKKFTAGYRDKNTQPLYHQFPTVGGDNPSIPVPTAALASKDGQQGTEVSGPVDAQQGCTCIKWHDYDIQSIIDARFAAKLPCKDDQNRHAESLKLATDLLLMFDGDKQTVLRIVEAQPWVQEIIDERDENVEQTVESAAAHKRKLEEKVKEPWPSNAMQEAIQKATGKTYQEITKATTQTAVTSRKEDDINRWLWQWGEQIEALSEDFPILKDICKGLKRNQYPAALFVGGGLLMTLMTRCTYRFYHRPEELRRLNNSTLIIGDPASGKSFATRLYKLLTQPIVEADQVGKDAINAYREQMRTKGANKEKPKKPKVIVRIHPARTSNAQFIQDMVNSVEEVDGKKMQLHMLTFDTELDNTVTVQKGGSWIDKQSLELKAFHNEEDGQAYSNNDSIIQDFFVYWNFIYTGTPIALKKKVNEQNFGSGLATRLTVIPLPATNFEMMARESTVDYDSDGRLKDWAKLLDRTKGELSVQKIVDELYDWTARRMADAAENESRADEMLLKRCAYHGLNFSAPFIVMRHWDELHQDGNYWCGEFTTDETDWKLAELIVNMQYACQRHYFGAMAEAYFDNKLRDATANVQRQQKTIEGFNRLPEVFTTEDVKRCFGLNDNNSAGCKIGRLLKDHLAEKAETFTENGHRRLSYRKKNSIL
ncbi:MAG: hypothetical protein J6X23_05535 [Bacteroidaceae bacterium]|nr:hypothetical protein [Bacteroidaceae bacterium]